MPTAETRGRKPLPAGAAKTMVSLRRAGRRTWRPASRRKKSAKESGKFRFSGDFLS